MPSTAASLFVGNVLDSIALTTYRGSVAEAWQRATPRVEDPVFEGVATPIAPLEAVRDVLNVRVSLSSIGRLIIPYGLLALRWGSSYPSRFCPRLPKMLVR